MLRMYSHKLHDDALFLIFVMILETKMILQTFYLFLF